MALRARARAPWRAAWRARWGTATWIPAPCIGPWPGTARLDQHEGRITIDGHDVTRDIRTPAMDQAAASVAKLPGVRQALVARQRGLGADGGVVMEGRDIGTVVFPHADVKIYLDASAEERARRRATDEAHTGGQQGSVAAVQHDLVARDRADSTRAIAPLTLAPDAAYIDTTGMPIEVVVHHVMMIVHEKLTEGP